MTWNHRILAHKYKDQVQLQIHEVYYDENNKPKLYTKNPTKVYGENLQEINWVLEKMKECINKPILWGDNKFPQECKIEYICKKCGRNKFDKPIPHKCKDGFSKKGDWEIYF